jgi:hypothetical protein
MFTEEELREQIESAKGLDELAKPLNELIDGPYRITPDGRLYFIKALVGRIGSLRLVIWPNDYPPPHFHVVGPDVEASFYIESCDRKDGSLDSSRLQKVRWWHTSAKRELLRVWNETRLADRRH